MTAVLAEEDEDQSTAIQQEMQNALDSLEAIQTAFRSAGSGNRTHLVNGNELGSRPATKEDRKFTELIAHVCDWLIQLFE